MRITVRRTMFAVACPGLILAGLRWFLTTYVLATYAGGYTEAGFDRLTIGMTQGQVEAIVGPPLRKTVWQKGDGGSWIYADAPLGVYCEQRRVVFKNGKVRGVVKAHWRGDITVLE
jgi:hypothetical protein